MSNVRRSVVETEYRKQVLLRRTDSTDFNQDQYNSFLIWEMKADVELVRKQLQGARKLLEERQEFTLELKETLLKETDEKLATLDEYDIVLDKAKDLQSVATIEWFLDDWHREERFIQRSGGGGIPGIKPPRIGQVMDPVEAEGPMVVPSFEPPPAGRNPPIPPPDQSST